MDTGPVLEMLERETRAVLGEGLVGLYVVGSFALGCADEHSDLDVVAVTASRLGDVELADLSALHQRLPDVRLPYADRLEGSYAPAADLRSPMALGRSWPYVDDGSRVVEHSDHDNTAHGRWVLREHGIVVTGPPPPDLVAEQSPASLFAESIGIARGRAAHVEEHPEALRDGWYQPHLVLTLCRVLFTASEGEVVGKVAAAEWALPRVPPDFHELVRAAVRDRPGSGAADPALAVTTRAFAHEVVRMVSS